MAALLLCGGIVGAAFYVGNRIDRGGGTADRDPATAASPSGPTGAAPQAPQAPQAARDLDCRLATPDQANRRRKVGPPDFATSPRTGSATMAISTNQGNVTISMDRAKTPCTVASFAHLAAKRFFDGTSCHRLVDSGIFVLQCGDPVGDGTGGPDYQFADENLAGAHYDRGIVAMANAGADTNGSQFFIMFRDSELPPQYTPFGEVQAGMDVIDKVANGGHDGAYDSSAGGGHPKIQMKFLTVTVT